MTRRQLMTEQAVAEAIPAKSEYAISDQAVPGLSLRVRPNGNKTWVLRAAQRGIPRRTLGAADKLTVAEARLRAQAVLNMPAGPSPRPADPTITFSAFAAVYRMRRTSQWKLSSQLSNASYIRASLLPTFAKMRLSEIRSADVALWFYTYSRKSPGGANQALWLLKNMLKCASDWGLVPGPPPVIRVKRNRRPPKGHVLSEDELHRLGSALANVGTRGANDADAIRLILLTGCRPSEIRRLTWAEVRPDRLELEDTKTGARSVHLGAAARELLDHRRPPNATGPVFPSRTNSTKPTGTLIATWPRVKASAGLPATVRLHDLRHTFASHSVMSGETLLTTGGLLGHRRAESTARYAHLTDDYLSAAADRIGGQIAEWMVIGRGLPK